MKLAEQVRLAGVVGAGGGGFPAHVKLSGKADIVIANGAECEPLLYKDGAVMERRAADLLKGVELAMKAVGAERGVIAVKAKKKAAAAAVQKAVQDSRVEVFLLGDYYPAGDEYDLVYTVTGRLIPPGGIPLHVGAVVNNVETLVNVAAAARGEPVLEKYVTVAGAVARPLTLKAPVGTPFADLIQAAGGATADRPVCMVGGLMMGSPEEDLDAPVTKTTTGIIVLPRSHHVVQRLLRPPEVKDKIGKSACDQCRYCTEYCPRYLLGYAVEPHRVMRSLGFTAGGEEAWDPWAALCCGCGLCTLYACPEGLYPKEACDRSKARMKAAGARWEGPKEVAPHPMREGRRVPIQSLIRRLHVEEYNVPAPFEEKSLAPRRLRIPLRQGAGAACRPQVKPGERVRKGQLLGSPPEGALGAPIHAPRDGKAVSVDGEVILEVEQ